MCISEKASLGIPCDELRVKVANSKIHFREFPSGFIRFLSVDIDIIDVPLMFGYKFFTHYKHSTTSRSRIIYASLIWLHHFYHKFYNRLWRIELSSLFSFCICKLPKKIFIDLPKKILRMFSHFLKFRIRNEINELPK